TKFMGETLFDENVGGKNGNMHLAIGMAYKDSYTGDPSKITKKQWEKMGFNDSVIHTDIVTTENKTVTAYLPNKKTKVIYKDGKFTV
ncbi:MAG: aminopeptidase, partial [Nanoarchaeota archaeon]|nr:aminopeptidase [Nanoarchaeota archaeon]